MGGLNLNAMIFNDLFNDYDYLGLIPSTAEYEKGLGLDRAIGNTLKQTNSHGKRFKANYGVGCDLTVEITKSYAGHWKDPQTQDIMHGAYAVFRFTASRGCKCLNLRVIQFVRYFTLSPDNFMLRTRPHRSYRQKRAGWPGPAVTILEPKYDLQNRPYYEDPSIGWMVDTTEEAKTPYYTNTPAGKEGSGPEPTAIIYDAPSTSKGLAASSGKEFRTCAIDYGEDGKIRVLGCLDWGYYINDKKNVSLTTPIFWEDHNRTPLTPGLGIPLESAVNRWNGIKGNEQILFR